MRGRGRVEGGGGAGREEGDATLGGKFPRKLPDIAINCERYPIPRRSDSRVSGCSTNSGMASISSGIARGGGRG